MIKSKTMIAIFLLTMYVCLVYSVIQRENTLKETETSAIVSHYESVSSENESSEELLSEEKSSTTIITTKQTTKPMTETKAAQVSKVTTKKIEVTTEKNTTKHITTTKKSTGGTEYEVPNIPDFKSWTNYEKSVNRNSPQWRFLNSEGTWTDKNGFRRKNNDYMVAMGSYYTHTLGDRFLITTEKSQFTVSIIDFKADSHTDSKHQYSVANNCIVEFYVSNNLNKKVKNLGSASAIKELSGKIIKIEKI